MSRPVYAFAAVLCVGALVGWTGLWEVHPALFWAVVLALALLTAAWARRPLPWLTSRGQLLCDTCKLNDARYCRRPERPNATSCPDYMGRG